MNKLKGSLAAKIVAIVLLAASCLALLGAGLGVAFLEEHDAYRSGSAESARERLIDETLEQRLWPLLERMVNAQSVRAAANSGACVELLGKDGQPLWSSLREDETVERSISYDVYGYYGGLYYSSEDEPLTAPQYDRGFSPEPTPKPVTESEDREKADSRPTGTRVYWLRMSWTDRSESGRLSSVLRAYELLFPWRYALIAVAIGAFILAVLLFVFLMAAAGHHDASGEVRASFVEKIPADLLL